MKSVAIMHFSCSPVIGGVETVIEAHTNQFLKNGYKVTIITGKGERFRKEIQLEKIPQLDAMYPKCKNVRSEIENSIISRKFYELKEQLKEKITQALHDINIFVIHNILSVHFNLPVTVALHEIIPQLKTRVISWCHDITLLDPNYQTGNPQKFPWSVLGTPIKNITYVVISELRRKELSKLLHIPKDTIQVVPDGVDEQSFLYLNKHIQVVMDKYNLKDADIVMLFPARIIKRKNLELGIRITAELAKMKKDAYLIITGPPDPHNIVSTEYYKELKKVARESNVADRIVFLYDMGINVTYEMLRELYSIADILLLTSTREGFGIPLLEAGIMKTPIFCPEIAPLTEVGERDVNYFSARGKSGSDRKNDSKKIAQSIMKVTSETKTAKMFRKVLQNYTWDSIFKHKILPLLKS